MRTEPEHIRQIFQRGADGQAPDAKESRELRNWWAQNPPDEDTQGREL